jgi:AmpD protein
VQITSAKPRLDGQALRTKPMLPSHATAQPTSQDALWQKGWYRFAQQLPSPNAGPRPPQACIDLIVLHAISLPPGQYGTGDIQKLFTNQLDWAAHPYFQTIQDLQVSAHFLISRTGELQQFVSCDARAWHAGVSSYRGRSQCNDDSIGIELEGTDGAAFEAAQYESLSHLCAALLQHYPIAYFAGHEHIAPGRKTDPGAGFDWLLLRQSLGLAARYFP